MNANSGKDKGEKILIWPIWSGPLSPIPDLEFSSISVPISDPNMGSVHPYSQQNSTNVSFERNDKSSEGH